MAKTARSTRRRSVFVLGTFLYLWVMVAVAITSLTIVGPLHWLTGRSELSSWPYAAGLLTLATLVLILLSFFLTRWLLRITLLSRARAVRTGIPAIITLVALWGAWVWLTAPAVGGGISLLGILAKAAG